MTETVKKLKELVDGSDNIVFFGGAGVSTESGIPDFRSTDGLYHQQWKYPPEVILSHTFYESNPEEFFRFYRAKLLAPDAKPNAAHHKLAEWEHAGKLKAIVTAKLRLISEKGEKLPVVFKSEIICIFTNNSYIHNRSPLFLVGLYYRYFLRGFKVKITAKSGNFILFEGNIEI